MQYGVNVRGDYQQVLDKLEASVSESVLRSAGFAGADIFRDEAKIRVPVLTGTIKANIIVKRIEEASGQTKQTYYVTVRTGKKNAEGDAFYWKWVEFGTSKMAARPFMRPAFDAKSKQAIEAMEVRLSERLREIIGVAA